MTWLCSQHIPTWAWIVGYGVEAILLCIAFLALKKIRRRQG